MPNKMERFTQRARRVLSLAQAEAERLQHSTIGTEHFLLGLLKEEGGIARRVLYDLSIDLYRAQRLVEQLSPPGERATNARLDLTKDVKLSTSK